jgi:chromate transporter
MSSSSAAAGSTRPASSTLHALNFAMLLPGPEAHQLAIYLGWLLNGAPGALVAGIGFLLPALVLMLGLSWLYVTHGDVAWVSAVLDGLAWTVVGIVAAALVRMARRALRTRTEVALAAVAFLALFVFGVPFPVVVIVAGALGMLSRNLPDPDPSADAPTLPARVAPSRGRTLRVLGVGLLAWLGPLALVALVAGPRSVFAQQAIFFSVMALVTFGGAYAVLAYVQQAAVVRFGWLSAGEMAVGLSLAETTPGPLILTVVFVAFLGASREPGALDPVLAGVGGGLVAAWATFVPSFVWIFLGAPSVELLRGRRRLAAALSAITAAVVGVIANLGLVFAIDVLFARTRTANVIGHDVVLPVLPSADPIALAVACAAFVAVARFRLNVVWAVLGAGVLGLLRFLL